MPNVPASALTGRLRAAFLVAGVLVLAAGPALALSELKTIGGDPVTPGQAAGNPPGLELDGANSLPGKGNTGTGDVKKDEPPASIIYSHDASKLPEPVRKMREQIIEAAISGDPERLRALIGTGDKRTQIPAAEANDDPIEALKSISGDADGLEILAIILDLVTAGYAHVNPGEPDEVFVWPYFAEKNIQSLSAPEKVELLRIVTAGDLMGMQDYGSYNFFQIGLTPDGRWKFLTAGD